MKIHLTADLGAFSIMLLEHEGKPYALLYWLEDTPRPEGYGEDLQLLEGRDPEEAFLRYMKFTMWDWEPWDESVLAYPEITYGRIFEILNKNIDKVTK